LSGDLVSQVEDYESLNDELQTELFMDSKIDITQDTNFIEDENEDSEMATDEDIEAAETQMKSTKI